MKSLCPALLLALFAACQSSEQEAPAPIDWSPAPYVDVVDIPNATSMGPLILAGQPTAAQLEELQAKGVEHVLDLCQLSERPDRDEQAEAQGFGMSYRSLPIAGPDSLTDAYFEEIRGELKQARERSTLLHCRSANRVGAVLIPYLVLDEGVPLADAIVAAKGVGLRSATLEERAVAYTKSQQ